MPINFILSKATLLKHKNLVSKKTTLWDEAKPPWGNALISQTKTGETWVVWSDMFQNIVYYIDKWFLPQSKLASYEYVTIGTSLYQCLRYYFAM